MLYAASSVYSKCSVTYENLILAVVLTLWKCHLHREAACFHSENAALKAREEYLLSHQERDQKTIADLEIRLNSLTEECNLMPFSTASKDQLIKELADQPF